MLIIESDLFEKRVKLLSLRLNFGVILEYFFLGLILYQNKSKCLLLSFCIRIKVVLELHLTQIFLEFLIFSFIRFFAPAGLWTSTPTSGRPAPFLRTDLRSIATGERGLAAPPQVASEVAVAFGWLFCQKLDYLQVNGQCGQVVPRR